MIQSDRVKKVALSCASKIACHLVNLHQQVSPCITVAMSLVDGEYEALRVWWLLDSVMEQSANLAIFLMLQLTGISREAQVLYGSMTCTCSARRKVGLTDEAVKEKDWVGRWMVSVRVWVRFQDRKVANVANTT